MNPTQRCFPIAFLASFLSAGCAIETTTTTQTHILDTKIDGPMMDIPVHVTTPSTPHTVTLTPFCSIGTKKPFTGTVEGSIPWQQYGFYPLDTVVDANGKKAIVRRIPEHNLVWTPSSMTLGADIDFTGELSAISFGFALSRCGGATNMGAHGNAGIFATRGSVGFRFDVGFDFGRVQSQTSSVAITTQETRFLWCTSRSVDTAFYFDEVSQTRFNYFAAFTFNTTFERFPVNLVLQGAAHLQQFLSYVPSKQYSQAFLLLVPTSSSSSEREVSLSALCLSLAPGIFIDLAKHLRLTAGARFIWPLSANIVRPSMPVSPFARIDFLLGNPSTSQN